MVREKNGKTRPIKPASQDALAGLLKSVREGKDQQRARKAADDLKRAGVPEDESLAVMERAVGADLFSRSLRRALTDLFKREDRPSFRDIESMLKLPKNSLGVLSQEGPGGTFHRLAHGVRMAGTVNNVYAVLNNQPENVVDLDPGKRIPADDFFRPPHTYDELKRLKTAGSKRIDNTPRVAPEHLPQGIIDIRSAKTNDDVWIRTKTQFGLGKISDWIASRDDVDARRDNDNLHLIFNRTRTGGHTRPRLPEPTPALTITNMPDGTGRITVATQFGVNPSGPGRMKKPADGTLALLAELSAAMYMPGQRH